MFTKKHFRQIADVIAKVLAKYDLENVDDVLGDFRKEFGYYFKTINPRFDYVLFGIALKENFEKYRKEHVKEKQEGGEL